MGHTATAILMVNRRTTACVLDGYPTVAGASSDGTVHPFDAGHGTYFGDPGLPGVMGPGESTALTIETSWACTAAETTSTSTSTRWSELELGLPAGGSVRVRVEIDSVCGVSVSRFGLPSPVTPPATPAPLPPSEEKWKPK